MTGLAVALESVPQLAFQVTAVLLEFATVAVKVCLALANRLAVVGETETATGSVTVTVALADFVLSALLLAVTEQLPAVAGAVYVTGLAVVLDSVPQLAFQVMAVLVEPVTFAISDWVFCVTSEADAGETETVTTGLATALTLAAKLKRVSSRAGEECRARWQSWRESL